MTRRRWRTSSTVSSSACSPTSACCRATCSRGCCATRCALRSSSRSSPASSPGDGVGRPGSASRRSPGSTGGCSTTAWRCRWSGPTSRRYWRRRTSTGRRSTRRSSGRCSSVASTRASARSWGRTTRTARRSCSWSSRSWSGVGAGEGGSRSRAGMRGSRPVARRADEAAQRGRASVPDVPDPAAGVHGTRSGVRLRGTSSTWRCRRSRTSSNPILKPLDTIRVPRRGPDAGRLASRNGRWPTS